MSFILVKTKVHSICLWNMSRVYKQGRKKIKLQHRTAFLHSEDHPFSFSHPQAHFPYSNLWGYLFKVCFVIFSNFTDLSHALCYDESIPSFFFLVCIILTHCIHRNKTWYGLFAWRSELFSALFLLHVFLCIAQSKVIFRFSFFTLQISQPTTTMSEFWYLPVVFGKEIGKVKRKGLIFFPFNLAVS